MRVTIFLISHEKLTLETAMLGLALNLHVPLFVLGEELPGRVPTTIPMDISYQRGDHDACCRAD